MNRSVQDIGASFDARAERYNQNEWHRACAERLVKFSDLGRGSAVLDAGTGTGFAAKPTERTPRCLRASRRVISPPRCVIAGRCVMESPGEGGEPPDSVYEHSDRSVTRRNERIPFFG